MTSWKKEQLSRNLPGGRRPGKEVAVDDHPHRDGSRCRTPQWNELGYLSASEKERQLVRWKVNTVNRENSQRCRGHGRKLDFILNAVWVIIFRAAYTIPWIVLTVKDLFLK